MYEPVHGETSVVAECIPFRKMKQLNIGSLWATVTQSGEGERCLTLNPRERVGHSCLRSEGGTLLGPQKRTV